MPEARMLVCRILLVLPAVTLVLLFGYVGRIWKKLPDTVASHFDAAGVPNGWSSKGFFVALFLILASGVGASIYTLIRIHRNSAPIGILYFVFVFVVWMFWLSLRANIQSAHLTGKTALPGAICGLAFAALAAWSMR